MEFDINKEKIQIEKDGKLVDCDMLFSFFSEDVNKIFFGYTDHSMKDGREMMYISAVNMDKADENNPLDGLEKVTDQKDLEIVGNFLNNLDKEINSQEV